MQPYHPQVFLLLPFIPLKPCAVSGTLGIQARGRNGKGIGIRNI